MMIRQYNFTVFRQIHIVAVLGRGSKNTGFPAGPVFIGGRRDPRPQVTSPRFSSKLQLLNMENHFSCHGSVPFPFSATPALIRLL